MTALYFLFGGIALAVVGVLITVRIHRGPKRDAMGAIEDFTRAKDALAHGHVESSLPPPSSGPVRLESGTVTVRRSNEGEPPG